MPFESEISDERTILKEFRYKVADFLPENLLQDDFFLRRWLIARDFNVEKAAMMLKKYMEWRDEYEIDKIFDWQPPADIVKACPYEISFCDRSGRPVLIFPWASWTPWDFVDNGRREEYIKYGYYILEKCVAAIKPPATQFTIIADSEGFSIRHMSKVKAIEANLEVLRRFESCYPELLSVGIGINCPRIFSLFYAIIKPLMSSRTQEKVEIFDCNTAKWQKRLVHYISETELPEKYGGERNNNIKSENSIKIENQII